MPFCYHSLPTMALSATRQALLPSQLLFLLLLMNRTLPLVRGFTSRVAPTRNGITYRVRKGVVAIESDESSSPGSTIYRSLGRRTTPTFSLSQHRLHDIAPAILMSQSTRLYAVQGNNGRSSSSRSNSNSGGGGDGSDGNGGGDRPRRPRRRNNRRRNYRANDSGDRNSSSNNNGQRRRRRSRPPPPPMPAPGKPGRGCFKELITRGLDVWVIKKQHQRSGEETRGVVDRLLTNSPYHPRGIKVMLNGGEVGRVIRIAAEEGSVA